MKLVLLKICMLFIFLSINVNIMHGQTVLERVSIAERSDGLEYVTRFHLSEPVDSFRVAHTEGHYVQLELYSPNLVYDGYKKPESEIAENIIIRNFDQSTTGMELFLNASYLFKTDLYYDINRKHLLLSLTTAEKETVLNSISGNSYLFEPTRQSSGGVLSGQEQPTETIDSGVDETGEEQSKKISGSSQDDSDLTAPNSTTRDDRVHNYPRADNTFRPEDEYYQRLLQILGISTHTSSYNLRPVRNVSETEAPHPWDDINGLSVNPNSRERFKPTIKPYQAILFQSFNSTVPRGNNDGAIWQGKGHNVAFSAGFEATSGPLKVRFRPIIGSAENREFDLGPLSLPFIIYPEIQYREPASMYAYRADGRNRSRIDYIQRFGNSRYSWADLGESAVELNYRSMRLAISNEKIWTGPAHNVSLLLGYSAPGFNHLYMGTNKPAETPLGSFEFAYIFGRMEQSDYFDSIDYRNSQSINAVLVSFSPTFAKKRFSIGAIRAYFFPYPKTFDEYRKQASKLYETPLKDSRGYVDGSGAVNDNQIAILFSRYFVPSSGFETYIEYGRNDHNANFRDLLGQPSHHRAFSVGITKAQQLSGNRIVAVNLEINQLEPTRTTVTRGGATIFNSYQGGWYLHSNQIIGISNRGQIPGTGYGVGVNMQQIKVDLFHYKGKYGLKLARIAYHNAFVTEEFGQVESINDGDIEPWEVRKIELLVALNGTFFQFKQFEISASIEQSITFNNHYIKGNDIHNTRIELVLKTNFNGWKR